MLVSNALLFEVAKVLRYPRIQNRNARTETDIYEYVAYLREVGEVVPLDLDIHIPIRDANDIIVAQTAILGEADYLCTIDQDFFAPATIEFLRRFGVRVIKETELIHLLRAVRSQ